MKTGFKAVTQATKLKQTELDLGVDIEKLQRVRRITLITRERDAKLQGFQLFEDERPGAKSILDAGDIKSNHYYFHKHTYMLDKNEKIVGFRATKDPKGLAYFYNFQFVVMKQPDCKVKTYEWKEHSAQYRIFQRLLEKNWNYLKYLDFETFLNDADCVRFQAYLQN